jgi:hypothetical protein
MPLAVLPRRMLTDGFFALRPEDSGRDIMVWISHGEIRSRQALSAQTAGPQAPADPLAGYRQEHMLPEKLPLLS